MQAALQTGQIDIAQQVSYAAIPALRANPNIKLLETGAGSLMAFPMWVDTAPFNDNRVREALKYTLDRQKIIDTILLGFGVPGDDNPIPPTSPYAWRSQVRKQDIPMAKKLLAEAGYGPSKPLKVDLYTADMIPTMVNLAQLFKQMAAEAGVEVNVIVGPASEYWDNVWLKHSFQSGGWSARPPGEALAVAYLENAPCAQGQCHSGQHGPNRALQRGREDVESAGRRTHSPVPQDGGWSAVQLQRLSAERRIRSCGFPRSAM